MPYAPMGHNCFSDWQEDSRTEPGGLAGQKAVEAFDKEIKFEGEVVMSIEQHHDTESLCKRIKKIEGQLGGIRRMLENDKPCDEIIIQLNSAKSALQKISQIVLEDHLDHCVLDALRRGEGEDQIESIKRALSQYTKMV